MKHRITLTIQGPDGATGTTSKIGADTGHSTDAELIAAAERAALTNAPTGAHIIHTRLVRSTT